MQPDLKKLVAYSSVSHMGFVTLGIFVFQQQGLQGAVLQMVTHGIITGALFLWSASSTSGPTTGRSPRWAASRRGRRSTPRSSASSCWPALGLPGLAGFVGEFLVFVGHVRRLARRGRASPTLVDDPRRGYLLWMFQRVVFGELSDFLKGLGHHLTDIDRVEVADAGAAGGADHRLRRLPGPLLDLSQAPVTDVLRRSRRRPPAPDSPMSADRADR